MAVPVIGWILGRLKDVAEIVSCALSGKSAD